MKKILMVLTVATALIGILVAFYPTSVYATNSVNNTTNESTNESTNNSTNESANEYKTDAIDEQTEGKILEIKESQTKSLKDYQKKYNSDSYGLVAYILHAFQIYSIPFCFIGIVISIMYKVMLGTRNLENAEKGLGMIVAIVTLTIICQVLPLIFAIVVKLGKE